MSSTTPRTDLDFDAFYKDARGRLLLQTYALTGDLPASRSAVRDSFSHAWQHWRKVSRLEDPESWVRPHAWSHAQRLHTARIWHRDKGLDPEHRATLEALGKLPLQQRRVLLLNQLSSASLRDMAREVGLPAGEAERALQTATATFSVTRDVPTTRIRALLEDLRPVVDGTTWPRGSILRRAGERRRRAHTVLGVAVTVVAVVASGAVATDSGGSRPDLTSRPGAGDPSPVVEQQVEPLPESAMLTAEQLESHVPGRRWTISGTDGNTTGDGLVMPCQQERYADPHGAAALVREFGTTPAKGAPTVSAMQSTELSRSAKSARRAYNTTLSWFGGCLDDRAQLLSTHTVRNVGDDATLLVLRTADDDARTVVVGVTRSGKLTSTTLIRTSAEDPGDLDGPGGLVAAAVNTLCTEDGGGACATNPRVVAREPVPVGVAPGMLAEVDLPPVPGVEKAWIGTEPKQALTNMASTPCDNTAFTGDAVSHALTRTFIIAEAEGLPEAFGVTETVGTLPAEKAKAFAATVRERVARCAERDLGTDVERLAGSRRGDTEIDVWRMTTELTDERSVVYLMGLVRRGSAVAQVGFIPAADATTGPDAFVDLVGRAGERLGEMPPPS